MVWCVFMYRHQPIHHWHHEPGDLFNYQPTASPQLPLGALCQPHGTGERFPRQIPASKTRRRRDQVRSEDRTVKDCWLDTQSMAASQQVFRDTQFVRSNDWTEIVLGLSHGCWRSSSVVHRPVELLYCSLLVGSCSGRHIGMFFKYN